MPDNRLLDATVMRPSKLRPEVSNIDESFVALKALSTLANSTEEMPKPP